VVIPNQYTHNIVVHILAERLDVTLGAIDVTLIFVEEFFLISCKWDIMTVTCSIKHYLCMHDLSMSQYSNNIPSHTDAYILEYILTDTHHTVILTNDMVQITRTLFNSNNMFFLIRLSSKRSTYLNVNKQWRACFMQSGSYSVASSSGIPAFLKKFSQENSGTAKQVRTTHPRWKLKFITRYDTLAIKLHDLIQSKAKQSHMLYLPLSFMINKSANPLRDQKY